MRAATFTTYINAQTDPGLAAAFQQQTNLAVSSFSTIKREAEAATRATAGLLGGRGTAGAQVQTQALRERAVATRQIVTVSADAERAAARLAIAERRSANEAARAAREHSGLAQGLNTTATTLSVVAGRLDPVASRFNTLSRAVEQLTGLQLGVAAFGATLFALGRSANTYANLEARVRPFFETQKQANRAMDDIVGIATRSRSALEPVVDVYTRLTTVGQNIGLSARGIAQITEIATKAANLGGGTAQARDAALLQFGQALSGDFKAAGQEINSLKEQAPILFQAILKGYKDVDGTIGVTLQRFKQLSEAGQLSTAGVLDAVRRSSSFIDTMASRLPNTLSKAGTDLGNAITVQTGRFDRFIGFTKTLADITSTVAQNLRVIVGLALGVGAAFAAIKLGSLAKEGLAAAAATVRQAQEVKALDAAWVASAQARTQQHAREIAALEAERAEIRRNIAEQERLRGLAQRDIRRAAAPLGISDPALGASVDAERRRGLAMAEAQEEEGRATRRLIQERQRLNIINGALAGATDRAKGATEELSIAQDVAAKRTGFLRAAGSNLLALFGGPWGIAIAAATTAIYLLATAESAAEAATRKNEEAQRIFANSVDRTTGKLYEQIGATEKLAKTKILATAQQTSAAQVRDAGADLLRQIQPFLGDARNRPRFVTRNGFRTLVPGQEFTPEQQSLRAAARDFQIGISGQGSRPGSLQRLEAAVVEASKTNNALRSRLDAIGTAAGRVRSGIAGGQDADGNPIIGLRQAAARTRVFTGRGREGDVDLAFGERPATVAGGGAKPRTKAEIDAAARAEAASTDVQRARAALAKVKAEGRQAGESEEAYQTRLADAYRGVTSAMEQQKAARQSASAGRAKERKEARDAIQDARDEATAKRDAALLDLAKQGLNPNSEAFLQARIKILKTYDDEVNALDASRAASSSAAAQMIADQNRISAAAAAAGEKRRDILAAVDEAPKAVDRARDQVRELQRFVGTAVDGVAFIGKTVDEIENIKRDNPLGTGIYTQEMADADARRIERGLRKPLEDIQRDFQRNSQIAALQLEGRDAEAAALETRNRLLDQGVAVTRDDYEQLVRNEEQQQRINDALAQRERLVNVVRSAFDDARQNVETLLNDLPTRGAKAGLDFLKSFQQQFLRAQVSNLTERIFAGSDAKVRALLTGRSSADAAIEEFGTSVQGLTGSTSRGESAVDRFATAATNAAARLDQVAPVNTGAGALTGGGPARVGPTGDLIVTATRIASQAISQDTLKLPGGVVIGQTSLPNLGGLPQPNVPNARQTYNSIGSQLFGGVGKRLDAFVDKVRGTKTSVAEDGTKIGGSTFFKRIGDSFGTALQGAGEGAIASGFAKALGVKQSSTGAQIGGAVGALSGIPGGSIIGGLLGGTIGGLFGGKKNGGTAAVSLDQYGNANSSAIYSRGSGQSRAATGLANSVASGIQNIANQLGAQITGLPNITVGTYDGKYRVSTSGQTGSLDFGKKNKQKSTLYNFDDDQNAAITFAIRESISRAVISGISQASINIIKSGQDLDAAIQKAVAIESIPKRLLQITDPVKYAVTTLNEEFTKLISYLKEGGATAEQFADAQKLYDLERQQAIEQAMNNAASQINDFLKEMTGGSSSPLNKRTVYENAGAALDAFKSDITAGKVVDQGSLLNAARNFQDASRGLNGSDQNFFSDFDMLRSLLEKARDNAGMTNVSTLPASPFSTDSTVQAAIAKLQSGQAAATQTQTDVLGQKLDTLIGAVQGIDAAALAPAPSRGYSGGSSIGLLPGFGRVNAA